MHPQSTPTLGDELCKEMKRVRDTLIPLYTEIGPAGAFALMCMRHDLDKAARAMAEGDVVEMMRCYDSLKSYSA